MSQPTTSPAPYPVDCGDCGAGIGQPCVMGCPNTDPIEPHISYTETVEYMGSQGAYLAPDECRTCYRTQDKLVQNCTEHKS